MDDPAIYPAAIEPASVKVTLNDWRVVEVKSDTVKGSPQEPMSEAEFLDKFRSCLEFGVGAQRAEADKLADALMNIENATAVATALVGPFPPAN